MTRNFQESLKRAGLTQRQFGKITETLSGFPMSRSTTSAWWHGHSINKAAIALAELLAQIPPAERERFLGQSET